jgi:hypothetical protein
VVVKEKVKTFGDVAELRVYTKETGKIFRNAFAKKAAMLS